MSGVEQHAPEDCNHPRSVLSDIREPSIGDAISGNGHGVSLEATCEVCESTVLISAHIGEVMDLE